MTVSISTRSKERHTPPAVPGLPVVGVLPQIGPDPLAFFMNAARTYGDVVRLDFGPRHMYLVSHPDDIKYILQDNNRNFNKGYEQVKPLLGEGLLTAEGEFWRKQRRLIQPAFHRQQIAALVSVMTEATSEMLKRWQVFAARHKPFDAAREMMFLTQRIILRAMFGADIGGKSEVIGQAFNVALEHFNQLTFAPVNIPLSIPTPGNRRYQQALSVLDEYIYGLIAERRASGVEGTDLVAMLLQARDEDGNAGMSDKQIHDELMTMFLAGHETTATVLSWTWILLSRHPEIARRVRDEATSVLNGRAPTADDVPKLNTTRMVIEESMRIYPPVWMFARRVNEDDELGGYRVEAGSTIMISPYVVHHLPTFWENPEGFDPERFSEERSAGRHRFAYFPFSAGPRQCIGNTFAMTEAQVILAMIAQAYQLDLEPGPFIRPKPYATLRPDPGVFVTLRSA